MNILKSIKNFFRKLFKHKNNNESLTTGENMSYGIHVNGQDISHLFKITRIINLSSGFHTINYSNDKFIIPVFDTGYVKKYWQDRKQLKIEIVGNITLYEVTIL